MKRFNIRVYGIITNNQDQVLVADENRFVDASCHDGFS